MKYFLVLITVVSSAFSNMQAHIIKSNIVQLRAKYLQAIQADNNRKAKYYRRLIDIEKSTLKLYRRVN